MTTETLDALQPYSEVKAAIAKMKSESAGLTFDYETPKGNKLARSHVASLRSVKGDIERKRKELKAEALEYGRKVDAVAKELTGEIEAMIEVHQGPLDLIESREEARVAKLEERIAKITWTLERIAWLKTAAECSAKILEVERALEAGEWAEFSQRAIDVARDSLSALRARRDDLTRQEAEAAELARLREEQAKRDAENRAKLEAEARAKREEEIRAQAEAKAKREAADAAMAEARKKEAEAQAAINAERERLNAKLRKAEIEAEKARREKAESEAKAAEAQVRAARESEEKRKADAERAANVKHREKILKAAAAALTQFGVEPGQVSFQVVEAIAAGKIPHVKIEF